MPSKPQPKKTKFTLEQKYLRLTEYLVRHYGLSLEFLTPEPNKIGTQQRIRKSQTAPSYQPDSLLNSEQAATMLGLRSKTLANWRVQGVEKLQFRRIGGAVRYQYGGLVHFIEARKHENTSQY